MSYPARTATATTYKPLSRPGIRTAATRSSKGRTAARAARSTGRAKKSRRPTEPPPEIVTNTATGQRFKTGRFLGKGGFAHVYKFKDMATGKVYAGKVVCKSSITNPKAKSKLKSEIELHRSLDHENIVGFVQFMEDSKFVYIMLEICTNGSFMDLLKVRRSLTEPEVAYYMWQLLEATEYMHARNIIHRDLKLGNLFLDHELKVKVGDFGLATSVEHKGERKKTICGTPNYIAPEIIDKRNNGHSFEVDIWSIGVILYTMIIGKPPFETSALKTTYSLIKTNTYSFPPNKPISEAACSLIRSMLQARPSARPTIAQIKAHRFFTDNPIPTSLPLSTLKRAPVPSDLFADADGAGSSAPPSSAASSSKYAPRAPLSERAAAAVDKYADKYSTDKYTAALKAKYGKGTAYSAPDGTGENAPAAAPAAAAPRATARSSSSRPSADDDYATLAAMHEKLTQSFAVMGTGRSAAPAPAPADTDAALPAPVAALRWVDYSSRYGLGVQLSDGTIAVHFNDATKISLSANGENIDYIDRVRSPSGSVDVRQAITMTDYPEALQKKMTLLQYFKTYLESHLDRTDKDSESSTRASTPGVALNLPDPADAPTSNLVYVRKWLRTKHAIIFRTAGGSSPADRVVQVNFFDHTKVILSNDAHVITYIDKNRVSTTKSVDAVMAEQDVAVLNRVKYLKDVLRGWTAPKKSS